jgi:hypothetical protein
MVIGWWGASKKSDRLLTGDRQVVKFSQSRNKAGGVWRIARPPVPYEETAATAVKPALEGSLSQFALESGYFPGLCAHRAIASACERD